MEIKFINIDDVFLDTEKYLAHIDGVDGDNLKDNERLSQHTECVGKYYKKIIANKKIEPIFEKIFLSIFKKSTIGDEKYKFFRNIIDNVVIFHDFGKINSEFQEKLKNKIDREDRFGKQGQHSIISAYVFSYYFNKKYDENNFKSKNLLNTIFLCSYIISRHHGSLTDDLYNFIKKFVKNSDEFEGDCIERVFTTKDLFLEDFLGDYQKNINSLYHNADLLVQKYSFKEPFYILGKLIYSILLACDYYATTEYMESLETDFDCFKESEDIIEKFKDEYYNSNLLKIIREQEKSKSYLKKENINDVRTEIFLKVEERMKKEEFKDKNIYFLESPTGSGKSNIAMNISYNLLDKNRKKIVYAYPFNTLIEQNKKTLDSYYKGTEYEKYIGVMNSVTHIENTEHKEHSEYCCNYTSILFDRQFLHSPILITSNIKLFDILFGTRREDNFGLYQLANSVVVLDEIQAYNYTIWNEIIQMLELYSRLLNIKFVIMSATLPDLSRLLPEDKKDSVYNLIENPKELFENKYFKDRVKINFDLLNEEEMSYEKLINHMKENIWDYNKILIEFIYKKDAKEFYKYIENEFSEYEVRLITGEDNVYTKNEIVEKTKEDIKIILVSTQVIEAGVDIDMDLGYKDISLLENEEQFLGRINRSSKKENSKAFFFNLTDAKKIYRKSYFENLSVINTEIRKYLETKSFCKYFESRLDSLKNNFDDSKSNLENFDTNLTKLEFKKISEKLKLIDNKRQEVNIFFARELKNGLDGKVVWQEYIELLKNNEMDYSEKYIKLFNKKVDMSNFIYKIPKYKELNSYNDIVGDLIYIENGEDFFDKHGILCIDDGVGSDII